LHSVEYSENREKREIKKRHHNNAAVPIGKININVPVFLRDISFPFYTSRFDTAENLAHIQAPSQDI
jgi:hypothetical protein